MQKPILYLETSSDDSVFFFFLREQGGREAAGGNGLSDQGEGIDAPEGSRDAPGLPPHEVSRDAKRLLCVCVFFIPRRHHTY